MKQEKREKQETVSDAKPPTRFVESLDGECMG